MRKYLFADEAGDFAFARNPNVSRYFILCTITCNTCDLGHHLLELRRELAWRALPLNDYFHASEDKQCVRDAVFDLIRRSNLRIDATILEKSKAQPQTRSSTDRISQSVGHIVLPGSGRSLFTDRRLLHVGYSAKVGTQ